MPEPSTLVVFAGLALLLAIVPGPAVLYIVGQSVAHGRGAGFVSALGVGTGGMLHIAAAVAGLSALLVSSATAFTVVKYLGAAYLVWLGLRKLLGRDRQELEGVPRRPLGRTFREGVVVNVLNPKTALFFYSLLPQFVNPDGANPQLQMLALGAVFVVIAFATDSMWALVSGTAAEWLRSRRRFANIDRYGAGTIFVGLGVSSALAHPARS